MAQPITTRNADGIWVIRAGGAVIAETKQAIELNEANLPPVIYFPRGDIAMAFLEPSDTRSTCPDKGEATYFTIHTKSGEIPDAAWTYETPQADVAGIAGHVAFYSDKVTVEQL
ncbi:MAG: DUF427 domain-containing protein [Brevirhabdus sp.]